MTPKFTAGITALAALVLALVPPAGATVLTFDIYTNAAKTVTITPGAYSVPPAFPSYGDNVTDFSPPGAQPDGRFVNYGSAGGLTPNVTTDYGWFSISNPTGSHGANFVGFWDTGFTGLTNIAFSSVGANFYAYISLTPSSDKLVLQSLSVSTWANGVYSNETLKLVEDVFTAPQTLWSAGPDQGVTFHGLTNYAPVVQIDAGHTLYLVFGGTALSGNVALDNIVFESIPEPSTMLLLLGGGWLIVRRLRRR